MLDSIGERTARRWCGWLLAVYAAGAVVAAAQAILGHHDNNFAIFRGSFFHLVTGADLYAEYPAAYFDRFKYSPTFALLFAPFTLLPVSAGLALWNLVNAAALWRAIVRLLPPQAAALALTVVFLEMLGAAQNAQSNALVTACVILAYLAFEADRTVRAALAIDVAAIIKIFPAAAVALAIPRPKRLAFALIFAGVMAALIAAPLLVSSPAALAAQYRSWLAVERLDAAAGLVAGDGRRIGGVMEQLRLWLGVRWPNWPVQLAGTILLLLPLFARHVNRQEPAFRLKFLASLLIYMVIFNHQAESPSFVIAMTGIAIWYTAVPRGRADAWLLGASWFLVSFASSSLVPHGIRRDIVLAYGVKAVPCIIVWIVLQAELLGFRRLSELPEVDPLDAEQRPANGR